MNDNTRKTTGKLRKGKVSSKLDLELLLKLNPPKFQYKIDHFYYVLDLLVRLPYQSKKDIDTSGYVIINMDAFTRHVRNGSKILHYLKEHNILVTRPYTKGIISTGYKYSPFYEGELKTVEYRDKPYRPRKKSKRTQHNLLKHIDKFNKQITFDANAANEWIDQQPLYYKNKKGKKVMFDKHLNHAFTEKLQDGDFSLSSFPDNFGDGRIYHQITNMKSQLRHYISYKGEYFSELDLSESQIFLSPQLFNPGFYTMEKTDGLVTCGHLSKKVVENLPFPVEEMQQILSTITTTPQFSSFLPLFPLFPPSYMYGKTSVTHDMHSIPAYCSNATNGDFYDGMIFKLKDYEEFATIERKDGKFLIWRIINSKKGVENIPQSDYSIPLKIFKETYPDVHVFFTWYKSKDPKNLCRTLSNIESVLVLKRIVPAFMKQFPGIPIFPIHDSVMCPSPYLKYLEQIVNEETIKFIGAKPHYKKKELNPTTVENLKPWKTKQ